MSLQKFIDYNIRDVEIIIELEKKLKFIDLTVTVCHLCHVPYDQIYMSTMLNEGAILTYLKRKGIVHTRDVELWNPVLTFYHKSPDARYISQSNWVGKTDMFTVADVIDKYGYLMNEDQMASLEAIYPIRSAGYNIGGVQNDGSFYDATKSHEWNTNMPSLGYRQYSTAAANSIFNAGDIVNYILREGEDYYDQGTAYLLRVTTAYWKSQRKVGHLTKITDSGEVITEIVTEDYKVTDNPIYDTRLFKNKTKDNLVYGEHIDWIWINEVWGGVKIGPNIPSFWGMNNPGGFTPLYIGIDKQNIGPLRFQFKGDNSIYGCKLPVEGAVFSDRASL